MTEQPRRDYLSRQLFFRAQRALTAPFGRLLEAVHNQYLMDYPLYLAIDTAAGNELEGDYYEFGVFRGRSFTLAFRRLQLRTKPERFSKMKFVAFDSFEGLPETRDETAPSHYHAGAFAAPQPLFERACRRAGIPDAQLVIVPGWFDRIADSATARERLAGSKIAVCYIDCDVYESAVSALDFIGSRLQEGSMLVLDDWNRHHASSRHGIRRAVREWLERNPKIALNQIFLSKRVLFSVEFRD